MDELHISYSGNTAQCDCITGLAAIDPGITVISRSMRSRRSTFVLDNGVTAIGVSNINWNKQTFYLSIIPGQIRELFAAVRRSKRRKVVILSHNLPIFVALPILLTKVVFRRRRITWVAYLIDSVVYSAPGIMGRISRLSEKLIKGVDGIITYVPHSATDYRPDLPYAQVYFAIDEEYMALYRQPRPSRTAGERIIAYTGALTDLYGLDRIAACIELTKDTYTWVFAGSGQHADSLQRLASSDLYNVDFRGVLGRTDTIEVQRAADLLLCIRGTDMSPEHQYQQRYAASAKINEYLASGTPILTTDIDAIPEELKQFCERMPSRDTSPERILAAVEAALDSTRADEVRVRAEAGQRFAFEHFTLDANNRTIASYLTTLSELEP